MMKKIVVPLDGSPLAARALPYAVILAKATGAKLRLVRAALAYPRARALVRAAADLATGNPSSLGRAWHAGPTLFWRFAGLWVIVAGVALVAAASLAACIALAVAAGSPRPLMGLVLLPVVAAGVAVPVGASIVVPFAQRAIAVRDEGPVAALRDGWVLFETHLRAALLVWLLALVLGLVAGTVVAVGTIASVVLLGGIGALVWAAAGLGATTTAYGALALLLFVGALVVVAAGVNTFFWNYWTLACLRLQEPNAA